MKTKIENQNIKERKNKIKKSYLEFVSPTLISKKCP